MRALDMLYQGLRSAALIALVVLWAGGSPPGARASDPPVTAPATTTPVAEPVPASRQPGPHNTGPLAPDQMVSSAAITVRNDGAVIENVDVSGIIRIRASNVTVRNFRVTTGSHYAIRIDDGISGVVLEDGEVAGARSAGIYGGGFTARRLNIHDCGGDGIKAKSNVLIEACWIHHLGTARGSHADGIQIASGSDIVIRGNTIDMPAGIPGHNTNSAVFVKPTVADIKNLLIQGNWLNGGNYTVYVVPARGGEARHVRVVANLIGRDYRHGPYVLRGDSNAWQHNRWADTLGPADWDTHRAR